MTTPSLPPAGLVQNAEAVRALFGQFNLYDAELCGVRLTVARGGLPVLEADLVIPGALALPAGVADRARDYRVTLRCSDVVDVSLADFSDHNLVAEYAFEALGDETPDERRVRVAITGAPGCDIELRCLTVAVASVVPVDGGNGT